MTDPIKQKAITFLLLAVILTVLVATALPQLELRPGIPLPDSDDHPGALPGEASPWAIISINTFFRALLVIVVIFVSCYCSYMLLKGASFRAILRPVLALMALVLLASVVLSIIFMLANIHFTPGPIATEIIPPAIKVKGPPLAPLPPILILLVWIGLGIMLVLLGIWILRWQNQRSKANILLTLEAERAIQALKSGEDLKNVIVRCYREMSLVLKKEQGIELEETMTAREFESLLEAKGLPHDPVQNLTQLFEAARYGNRPSTTVDEQVALDCLNRIASYTREMGKPG